MRSDVCLLPQVLGDGTTLPPPPPPIPELFFKIYFLKHMLMYATLKIIHN